MFSLLTLAVWALLPTLLYIWVTWHFDQWRRRGVQGPKPTPLVGNFPGLITQKRHFADEINNIYKKYRDGENFVGSFVIRAPLLIVLDPTLVRDVFVTAFSHFHDNDVAKLVDPKKDPLICNNPFLVSGQHWKEQRALMTPGLTSSRIKVAYGIMQGVCGKLVAYMQKECKVAGCNGINGRELALRFTAENVSASVLGIDAHSFEADALPIAKNLTLFSSENRVFLWYNVLVSFFPDIYKVYKAKFTPQNCEDFFMTLMKRAFALRRTEKVERQDFLNHLMAIQEKKHLSDEELSSHSMTFLIDGLDTTATAISHCLLMLARYPQTQEKVLQEVLKSLDAAGQLPFEQLNEMPYLEACIHETLRIFPPALWSVKTCTEPYEFSNKNGSKVRMEKGEPVLLPIHSLHMDAAYYPEPEVFQPERFMPENGGLKKYREMGVYYGFGDGPRTCIGMRFALVQSKAAVAALVRNFHIRVNSKVIPGVELDPAEFLAAKKGGVWLDFETRN